jgi:hypothetical protein
MGAYFRDHVRTQFRAAAAALALALAWIPTAYAGAGGGGAFYETVDGTQFGAPCTGVCTIGNIAAGTPAFALILTADGTATNDPTRWKDVWVTFEGTVGLGLEVVGTVIASQDEPGEAPLSQSVIDDVTSALSTATFLDGTNGFVHLGLNLIVIGDPDGSENSVPEPTSLALLGAGLLGLAIARRRRALVSGAAAQTRAA